MLFVSHKYSCIHATYTVYLGDPAMLHRMIISQEVDIENLKEMTLDEIVRICTVCQVSIQRRSKVRKRSPKYKKISEDIKRKMTLRYFKK